MASFLCSLKLLLMLTFWVGSGSSSPWDHRYNVGDHVLLFVNKLGPLHNPSETYQYYDLPFCRPDHVLGKQETLGEVLNGDRMMNALYLLKFREDRHNLSLCSKRFTTNQLAKFRDAIAQNFYFQMYYDDLPLWGFIGKIEEDYMGRGDKHAKYYLFRHLQFDVLYNEDRVIAISCFNDPNHAVDISKNTEINIEFTYSIRWNSTLEVFKTRMDKYSQAAYAPISQKIHWFSFLNSISVAVMMIGLLSFLYMHHLKNDMRSGDEEENKDVGWKLIQSDVFRCPKNMSLLCAILGTGTQLLIMVWILFGLSALGFLYPYNRGALFTSIVVSYTLTSIVAGYTAASFHCQFSGTGWEKSVRLAGMLYTVPAFIVISILNTVAITFRATAALPFGTIILVVLIFSLLNFPLLMLGGVLGHRFRSEFQPPCAVKRQPKKIPLQNWYRRKEYQMLIGGLVPFSAVALELHQLYSSLWGFKIHTSPGILALTFIMLVLLAACVGVILTYIQLSGEDHQWWWRSLLCGGCNAVFMLGYGVVFYLRSDMKGLLQLSFYFGYNALFCYALFLILGTLSFFTSWTFVRRIYRSVKSE